MKFDEKVHEKNMIDELAPGRKSNLKNVKND